MPDLPLALAIWLGSYLLHSTVLYGLAWVVDRLQLLRSPALREQLWRAAMVGAVVTASLQSAGLAGRAPMASMFAFGLEQPAKPPSELVDRTDGMIPADPAPAADAATLEASAFAAVGDSLTAQPRAAAAAGPRRFALLWLFGACLLALRLGALAWRARQELAGRAEAAPSIRHELDRICAAHRIRAPQLSVTPRLGGPVALPNGEIVLPSWVTEALDLRQQRAVLAHELAHQVRLDPLWQMLALAAGTVLWVQPLHHLARRRLAALAELEADAWAARLLRDPRALAESLAHCAERLTVNRVALWSAGMVTGSPDACPLLVRIDQLLKGSPMSTPRASWPAQAGALAVLAAGIFLLPGCGPAGFASIGGGSSTSISISDDGDVHMSVRRPGYSLRLTCDGKVTFADDEADLATLTPGGEFEMTEKSDGSARTYRVKSDAGGALHRTFERDGAEVAADDGARQWLAAALPRMFRESGWDAEARAARLLARGGPELLLAEVEHASGSFAKSTYLGLLLGIAPLDAAQFDRALASAAAIGSDFELRTALVRALETQALDSARVAALLGTAQSLGSDFELRSVLERVAPRGGEAGVTSAYLTAARKLDSDFERRTALVALLEHAKLDAAGLAGALDVTASLGSDFEKRTVLEGMAKSVAGDPELNRRYREVARDMSDFERGQVLRALDDATAL